MTATDGAASLKWVRVRLYVVAGVMTLLLGGIGWEALTLTRDDHERMHAMGEAQYAKDLEIAAPRGSIVDAHGVELAVTVEVDSIVANPRAVTDVTRVARALAEVTGQDVRGLEHRLSGDGYFAWVARRVEAETARKVRELELPGIGFTTEPRRFYPGGELAATVLGFSNIDGKGIEGLELVLDDVLRGKQSRVRAVRDARGQLVLAYGMAHEGKAGATVTLTIDRFLQYTAEHALAEAVQRTEAEAGTAVVLDPWSGRVLAMASVPTFDPNRPGERGQARNRVVTDVFEPGSVMKAFVVAAALEAGVLREDEWIDTERGRFRVGRKMIRDTHLEDEPITVTEVLKYSSNVGAVKIARRLGAEGLHAKLAALGFGDRTGVGIPGERSGILRPPRRWGEIGLATHAYGYGMNATPLQTVAALATLANGGVHHAPRLVERIVAADGEVLFEHVPQGRRVWEEGVANTVRTMLRSVFEKGGTGQKLKVPGFTPAGKTGTIHKVDPTSGRYYKDRYVSAFAGFVPADDPRLVVLVLIDDPRGKEYYGGAVAGPVFTAIATEGLKYLGIAGTVEPEEAEQPGNGLGAVARSGEEGPGPHVANSAPVAGMGGHMARGDDGDGGRRRGEEPRAEGEGPTQGAGNRAEAGEAVLPLAGPDEEIVMIPSFTGQSMGQVLATARAAGVRVQLEGTGVAMGQFPEPGRARKSIVTRVMFAPR